MDSQTSKPSNPVFAHIRQTILDRLGEPGVYNKKHHFVLVHDGGHGAWCWYKIADLLQNSGNKVTVFDLAGSGLHPTDPNHISTLQQYAKPLVDALQSITDPEKVILVGHGLGGVCLAYATEIFASKIAVAVYLAAVMLPDGLPCLEKHVETMKIMNENDKKMQLVFANGRDKPATSVFFTKGTCKEILYNMSSSHDIQLASTLLRPIPMALRLAKVETSDEGYMSVPRVYIKTTKDLVFPANVQEAMIEMNPPHMILSIISDHSPFFSAPQGLHRMLLGIASAYDR